MHLETKEQSSPNSFSVQLINENLSESIFVQNRSGFKAFSNGIYPERQ